jgi:indolepyruvate ferredoxin oxidoreductase
VTCHVRIASQPADIHAVRIAAGEADLVLGCDVVVVNDYWALSKIRESRTHAVINSYQSFPGTFTRNPDLEFPLRQMVDTIGLALGHKQLDVLDATTIATRLLGDSIATNLFVLGYAWQRGLVPVSFAALMRAIELNEAAVAMNKAAFQWGRLAAHDLERVKKAAGLTGPERLALTDATTSDQFAWAAAGRAADLDEAIERRVRFLTDYQDDAYAARYRALVERTRKVEQSRTPGRQELTEAVARYAFKLMAYKDEYEVARLYSAPEFRRRLEEQFDGEYTLHFHLAPPLLAKRDPSNGHLLKAEYGPWMLTAFKWLAKLKWLRGTRFDPFGHTAERRQERQLIEDYFAAIEEILGGLQPDTHALAVEFARLPEQIRGYGHVKEAHLAKVLPRWQELLARWRSGPVRAAA